MSAGGDAKLTTRAPWWVGRRVRSRRALLSATFAAVVVIGAVVAAGLLHEHAAAPGTGPASAKAEALTTAAMRLDASDQQGLAMANQAIAQSRSPAVRAAAGSLVAAYSARLVAVKALLDRAGIPTRARFAAPLDPPVNQLSASGVLSCDLLADDDISRLADAPPETFDSVYRELAGRHAVGGVLLTDEVVARSAAARVDATELGGLTDTVRRAAAAL